MQPRVTRGCVFSLNCSNYLPNILAACLHCALGTDLWTAYVRMHHVSLLSHNDIYKYSFFLSFVTTHMAVQRLQFLVMNVKQQQVQSNDLTSNIYALVAIRVIPSVVLGSSCSKIKNSYMIFHKKLFKQISEYIAYLKTSKPECTGMSHAIEHIKSLPHILHISSIWILDAFP
jgi:hypothetical protein